MNLNRIMDIYEIIKKRLPSTYPRPKLAFFEDEESMLDNTQMEKIEEENVYAVVTPDTTTINLPMNMQMEHTNKAGELIKKKVPITKETDYSLAHTLIHELAHLYAGERYGYGSKKYNDEQYCNNFAARWIRVLKKEKLL